MSGGGILVVNAGSSSIKTAIFDVDGADTPAVSAQIDRIGSGASASAKDATGQGLNLPDLPDGAGQNHEAALHWLLPNLEAVAGIKIIAAGHRVVHGGGRFKQPALITKAVITELRDLIPLARTHQPHNIAAIEAVQALWPDLPQVACFDTAFHDTIPEAARTIALPTTVRERGVRRYGFHGLSYQWIASRLADVDPAAAQGRTVVAHLGNGASLCGLVAGESRATTMGFTPLDGLVMGERPGLTDPGAVLFLFEEMGMNAQEVRQVLFKESGLKGLSGMSNDMRTLEASDDPDTKLAIAVYVHRIVREIGAMAAEIGGIDALVFTAGIGENSASTRKAVIEGCAWLGCQLEEAANREARPCITHRDGRLQAYVIPTNEEAVIAASCRSVLNLC